MEICRVGTLCPRGFIESRNGFKPDAWARVPILLGSFKRLDVMSGFGNHDGKKGS
jgi:hypothetical protein